MNVRHLTPLALATSALLALGVATPPAAAQDTTRISVAGDGTQGTGDAANSSVSADGRYVAFDSDSNNLVPGDTNANQDVFVRDTVTGAVTLVSVATDGTQGNNGSSEPSISKDGRFVCFASSASNLVSGDTNGQSDIFVRDIRLRITTRVSVATDGTQGDGYSNNSSISGDGRYVAFDSAATGLVPNDSNGATDIFLHDNVTGTTTLVSAAADGTSANGFSSFPSISADGRYVAFGSGASNLVANDTNGFDDTFVRDVHAGVTVRASVANDGTEGNGYSGDASISADGRFVGFDSAATNLVDGDTNGQGDIFLRNLAAGTTTRVSVATDGTQSNSYSFFAPVSGDGRYVAFTSAASNLVTSDTNGALDIFLRDVQAGTTTRVSVATDGTEGDGASAYISISADGRYVAFSSDSDNLVTGDTNARTDIFLRGPISSIAPSITIVAGAPVKSSPSTIPGMVMFGDDAGKLHANGYDGADGGGFPMDVSAVLGAPVKIQSRPAIYYTNDFGAYFTTDRGDIGYVDAVARLHLFSPPIAGVGNTGSPAVTPDGTIYAGLNIGTSCGVVKLNPDLSLALTSDSLSAPGSTISSVAVYGNKIYVGLTGGSTGDIMVLNAADLTPLSSGVATGEGVTAPPYVVGQDMYVGTLAGNFYKLNSATSGVDTSFGDGGKVEVGEPLPTSAFYNDGAFYAGSSKGKVWKIGLDGSLSKAYDTWNPSAVVGGVVVERTSNTLAFGTSAGDFYKVPLNGGDAGIFGPTLGFETTPTYDATSNQFFIGSDDGNVYGF